MMHRCVIWLKGLETLNLEDYFRLRPTDELIDKTAFLTGKTDMSALEEFGVFLKNLDEATVVLPGAVIDVTVQKTRMRFIVRSLTIDEMVEYVYEAPTDRTIVITARPKGITKAEVEEHLTADDKLLIDSSILRSTNLAEIFAKKKSWSKECFREIFFRTLCSYILEQCFGAVKVLGINVFQRIFQ
ncbi:MAG: hypothetical protein K2K82_05570 [Muribaculaceae bacterium]|nr:hypothetical protein [Muribaculaceae bacterium]